MEIAVILASIARYAALAASAEATVEDAVKAFNRIRALTQKDAPAVSQAEVDEIDAECDAMEQRGLVPIEPPTD